MIQFCHSQNKTEAWPVTNLLSPWYRKAFLITILLPKWWFYYTVIYLASCPPLKSRVFSFYLKEWMPKLQGWWKESGPQPETEVWKEDFGERAGSGSVERFAPGRVIVLLWLLPPSPLAINIGMQLSLWIASSLGDTHTAIWRILTSLPSQSSGSRARWPGPGLSNQSTPWPTPPRWLD